MMEIASLGARHHAGSNASAPQAGLRRPARRRRSSAGAACLSGARTRDLLPVGPVADRQWLPAGAGPVHPPAARARRPRGCREPGLPHGASRVRRAGRAVARRGCRRARVARGRQAFDRYLPGRVKVAGASSGLHVVAWFDGVPGTREYELAAAALRHRVLVYPISALCLPGSESPAAARSAGLVLGYASLDAREIERGIKRLGAAVKELACT